MYDVSLLKKLRHANGLTQQQVADYLHVDRSTYAYYEAGRTKLNIDALIQITRMYHLGVADFLWLPNELPGDTEPDEIGPAYFSQLNCVERNLVILYRSGRPEQRKALHAAAVEAVEETGSL